MFLGLKIFVCVSREFPSIILLGVIFLRMCKKYNFVICLAHNRNTHTTVSLPKLTSLLLRGSFICSFNWMIMRKKSSNLLFIGNRAKA